MAKKRKNGSEKEKSTKNHMGWPIVIRERERETIEALKRPSTHSLGR